MRTGTSLFGVLGTSVLSLFVASIAVDPAEAMLVTLVDDSTPGYYNDALDMILDGTQPQFPVANSIGAADPTIVPAAEPDLSAADLILGSWLSPDPLPLGTDWSGPAAIPASWTPNSETAILYVVDAGAEGLENLTGNFGVDNGIFVWIDGEYKFGAEEPGFAIPYEYADVPLGSLTPGMHYVQILREDHGQGTGYNVLILGTPIENRPPDCSNVTASPRVLWPPNHKFVAISVLGVTDPEGEAIGIEPVRITQDEPLDASSSGRTCPDAVVLADGVLLLRAERMGLRDGRVYHVAFRATDLRGAACVGTVTVCVPKAPGQHCGDQGSIANSTGPCDAQ